MRKQIGICLLCALAPFLTLLIACSKEEKRNELSGTRWKAKIEMNSVVLPIQIDKNEQHYYELNFKDNEYTIDISDSNGIIVLNSAEGSYSLKGKELKVTSSSKSIQMRYYPQERYIFVNYYGMNFYKQQ